MFQVIYYPFYEEVFYIPMADSKEIPAAYIINLTRNTTVGSRSVFYSKKIM